MRLRNIDRIRQASAMTGALADRSTRIPVVGYRIAPRLYDLHLALHGMWHRQMRLAIETLEEHANGGR